MFKPFGGIARGVLNFQHLDRSHGYIVLQGLSDVIRRCQAAAQFNGIFQGELAATADRKVRRVRRIAHQHQRHLLAGNVLRVNPVLAHHARKADPDGRAAHVGGVVHERFTVQMPGKQIFTKGDALLLAHGVQTVRLPHRLWCLDNEGRSVGVKLVSVRGEPAVLGLLKGEGEGVEFFVRSQPDKAAGAQVDVGFEGVGVARAHPAVQAIAGNHQVRLVLCCQRLIVLDLRFKHQRDAELKATILQDVEQALASYAAKTMAA